MSHPAEQVPERGSHSGAEIGQSGSEAHCTQAWLTGSQRGAAPEQSASVRQPMQLPAAFRQNGVADPPPQTLSSPQDAQIPFWHEVGATQVLGVMSSWQVVTQRPAAHAWAAAQSVAPRQVTQR